MINVGKSKKSKNKKDEYLTDEELERMLQGMRARGELDKNWWRQ